jgi:hypothetical protein
MVMSTARYLVKEVMMVTLNQHFKVMVEKNLKPPDDRVEAAQELPGKVRDYLRACTGFPTVDPHTRLAGSYAQDMSGTTVKDVDVLVRVAGDPDENDPEAKQIIRDLEAALDALVDSDTPLGVWYVSRVEVNAARRSVHVYFRDEDFHLDIVPFIAPNGLDEPVYVPDKGYNEWVPSHPLGVIQLISDLDKEYGGKVRKLAKVLKHYRNQGMIYMRPKSYWLTSLLLNAVQNGDLDMAQPLPVLFRDLLAAIYDGLADDLANPDSVPPIPDPLLGHDVAHSWERHDFEAFMNLLDEGKRRMDRALKAADEGRLSDAVEICQRMFGADYFPESVEDEVKRMAAALSQLTYVTSQGGVLPTQPDAGRYTVAQPTRFYGEETD